MILVRPRHLPLRDEFMFKQTALIRGCIAAVRAALDLPVGRFPVQPNCEKYFARPVGQIISTSSPHPGPKRGAYRDRHERWARMRWTRRRARRARQCVRRSRVVLTPRRWRQVAQKYLRGDGDNKARSPGRARRKPLKPLRREGRTASAEPVCSCAFALCILHMRPRVQRAPGLPCALYFRG
jgi:hypothetical protein